MISHKLSFPGLTTEELLARRRQLASCIGDTERVLLGALVRQGRRCGRANCRCAEGEPHGPYAYFVPRRGRGMQYVPANLVASVRAHLRRGDRIETLLAQISAINVELLARRALE